MGRSKRWLLAWLTAIPLIAQAQVDLTALDRNMVGPRAQVLVLGTVHLNALPDVKPGALDGVLDRLAAFDPDIIAIESMPGEECDLAARHAAKYGRDYCAGTDAAKVATGLDVPAAIEEATRTLRTWPSQPTPAQRRRLAAVFLAAHDRASAYVQWLQLPEAERRAGDGLDAALVEALERIGNSRNENYQLGARLAARLGLQRVHAVDNHTGDNTDVADVEAFGKAIQDAWDSDREELDQRLAQEKTLAQAADLLPLYRYINAPESMRVLAELNILPALRAESAEHYPQIWVAGWEIRNLRMVANIRETFRERPGVRVLSIVGASHKPWFDDWLGQLQGVDIVEAEQVLR